MRHYFAAAYHSTVPLNVYTVSVHRGAYPLRLSTAFTCIVTVPVQGYKQLQSANLPGFWCFIRSHLRQRINNSVSRCVDIDQDHVLRDLLHHK